MKKIFNFFHRKKCNKYLIIQWGKNRSVIQNVSDTNNDILIIDNQHLMNLDERGLIL